MWRDSHNPGSVWAHRLALVTAGATFLLILVGGVVTTTGSGLAVPDWPTTFGYDMFSFPWAKTTGGILYEHSHRLIGSLVGLLTLSLAILLWVAESRRWVAWLGAAALAAVVVQGILGGLRVVLLANHLAFVHGVVAHGFLGLIVVRGRCGIIDIIAYVHYVNKVPQIRGGGKTTMFKICLAIEAPKQAMEWRAIYEKRQRGWSQAKRPAISGPVAAGSGAARGDPLALRAYGGTPGPGQDPRDSVGRPGREVRSPLYRWGTQPGRWQG